MAWLKAAKYSLSCCRYYLRQRHIRIYVESAKTSSRSDIRCFVCILYSQDCRPASRLCGYPLPALKESGKMHALSLCGAVSNWIVALQIIGNGFIRRLPAQKNRLAGRLGSGLHLA